MNLPPEHKALVVIAHGSRRAAANEEFFTLVERIAAQNSAYALTKPALLEQAPPTLLQACQALPANIKQIDVYPLFFNCGRHVEKDIPAQVAEVMEAMPTVTVRLLPYFGSSPDLAAAVLEHALSSTALDGQD